MSTKVDLQPVLIAEEDALRANLYGLLSVLLSRPADKAALEVARDLNGDSSELGEAFGELAAKAADATPQKVAEEYQLLFIGVGRGELLPYGSYYLTGFLNEKPLGRLRQSMRALGISRDPAVKEPEDHAAALMEMMAGLINGTFGEPASLESQRDFFNAHVGNWMPYFFKDLENAQSADFYRPVGKIGRLFLGIETAAFEME
ncbi:MAG: molecular chaperone TorD family protein [Alphaproteobacteria bacterium]|nr:molecular chaperone TorD family protein [Alphaproteobacteria bacterium]